MRCAKRWEVGGWALRLGDGHGTDFVQLLSDDVPGNHPLGMATSLHEGEGVDGVGCVEVGV